MKKREAIRRIADELQKRDQAACERAAEAIGDAGTITPALPDYTVLATEHFQRALNDLACERALANLSHVNISVRAEVKATPCHWKVEPHLLAGHYRVTGKGTEFTCCPTPALAATANSLLDFVKSGWRERDLRAAGYIH